MNRFQSERQNGIFRKVILPLCVFILAIALFYCGVDAFSQSTSEKQKESLEKAVTNAITYCYATEGRYPESAEYLEERYGLSYDKDRFYIGYRPMGSNILPDVTIIELEE